MNQILNYYEIEENDLYKNKQIKKKLFTLQFSISILLILATIIIYIFYLYNINSKENISKKLTDNYNISKLYSNSQNYNSINTYIDNGTEYSVIGLIEIPKINVNYPILSEINDDLLKIAPCKFYGPMPNQYGNLCIAGHNYDNYKFFSKISNLEINDEILIYDTNGNFLKYLVTDNFEVKGNEFDRVVSSNNLIKEITLITCNNSNSNRIIIKAKSES